MTGWATLVRRLGLRTVTLTGPDPLWTLTVSSDRVVTREPGLTYRTEVLRVRGRTEREAVRLALRQLDALDA